MAKKKADTASRPRRSRVNLDKPSLYFNRELSWLEFNDRVLREGLNEHLPPLERLKFLAIVSSNLDEFFMVRVAGLRQQLDANSRKRDVSGMTPNQQLDAIAKRVRRMVTEQSEGIARVIDILASQQVRFRKPEDLNSEQSRFLRSYFATEVAPVLTPLGMEKLTPMPLLPQLRLMIAVRTVPRGGSAEDGQITVVPVPTGLPRFIAVPAEEGLHLVRLEDVILVNLPSLFPGQKVQASVIFRITRDADVAVRDDEAGDLLRDIEEAISSRQRRDPVRLEISAHPNRVIKKWLMDWTGLRPRQVYEIDGMLDAKALFEVAGRPGLEHLKVDNWPVQPPRDLIGSEDLWQSLQEHDAMIVTPYEAFDPVVQLVEQAADDPSVLAIKQTLYRTSGDSPIIAALERAARAGKQVIVLVELKARFDEQQNVGWARRLEEAGAYVIYGIAGYKTHAKALLVIRREARRIRRYVHLATGNYNDKTAKLYSDVGVMTTHPDLCTDVATFFNLLTGYTESAAMNRLAIAPTGLRSRFEELIDREIQVHTPQEPGLIIAKTNSLQDPGIIKALYRASRAGVRVRLNVRGICCLKPGVKGVSENIEVVSIVDRYLEHARIFYFRNAGHEEVYMGSADWMTRNLDKRLEILFPVLDESLMRRAIQMLEVYFQDNVKATRLDSAGHWTPVEIPGKKVRAQETLHRQTVQAAQDAGQGKKLFRPMTAPE